MYFSDCSEILGLGTSADADRDRMIRTGEMTPFGTVVKQEKETANVQQVSQSNSSDSNIAVVSDKSLTRNRSVERTNASEQTNGVSVHGFEDDDLYDAEMEEPGKHSAKDDEWLPSNQDKESHSDDDMLIGVKAEKGNLCLKPDLAFSQQSS